ncbi:uncharacterized protein LOC122295757 isoform X1 [Carya illinoinensis]|uniref:uncharacterized protein LOC122295757 isoform X1 n=1 Tax=Carya illinoinensis TaxID=32201 RepID=UPI001C72136A|nr:uncharacterized protein LOC122295757 isoform X1 [Carya illinoinensis]
MQQLTSSCLFEVLDEEAGDDDEGGGQRKYKLPMSNIIPFPKRNDPSTAQDSPPGRQVLAVYPGATALYKATVVNNNHKRKTNEEASLDGADMEVVSSLLQACNALALRWIELLDCYKMLVNIANHVENPSLTELQQLKILSLGACSGLGVLRKKVEVGHLNDYFGRIIFPVDTILEWFNHCKEASNNTESCEIDIDGSDL